MDNEEDSIFLCQICYLKSGARNRLSKSAPDKHMLQTFHSNFDNETKVQICCNFETTLKKQIRKEITNTPAQPDQEPPPPPPALTPHDDRINFCTPASFVSVDEEEINNHQPTRVSPRNINFVQDQGAEGRPIQAPQPSMTRMDVFKRRLAPVRRSQHKQ